MRRARLDAEDHIGRSEGEWGRGVNQGHTPVVSQKSTCDDAHVKWAKHSPPPRAHTAEGHQVLHNVQVLSPSVSILMESALKVSEALWSVSHRRFKAKADATGAATS